VGGRYLSVAVLLPKMGIVVPCSFSPLQTGYCVDSYSQLCPGSVSWISLLGCLPAPTRLYDVIVDIIW
jgi:hypothetical protein